MSPTPPILEYHQPDTEPRPPLRVRILWLALHAPLLAIPFLSFAWEVNPLDTVVEFLPPRNHPLVSNESIFLQMAIPFFLVFPLIYFQSRQLFMRLAFSDFLVLQTIGFILFVVESLLEIRLSSKLAYLSTCEKVAFFSCVVILVASLLIVTWQMHFKWPIGIRTQTILTLSFFANAVFCLVGFYGDRHGPGYFLTIYACTVCLTDLCRTLWKTGMSRRKISTFRI